MVDVVEQIKNYENKIKELKRKAKQNEKKKEVSLNRKILDLLKTNKDFSSEFLVLLSKHKQDDLKIALEKFLNIATKAK